MVLGDTHGNSRWAQVCIEQAAEEHCDAVVQVGDFGMWEHTDEGAFLGDVSLAATTCDVPVYFIDGNHDNHPLLWSKYTEKDDEGFIKVRQNLKYIPRGHTWNWAGLRLMGVGGAVSIDKAHRIERMRARIENLERTNKNRELQGLPPMSNDPDAFSLWWATETLTPEQIEFAKSQGKVDVLFTHDAPTSIMPFMRFKNDLDSQAHRQIMNDIARAVKPRFWFHGHFHEPLRYKFPQDGWDTEVFGLACDDMERSYAIVDLDRLGE